MQDRDKVIDWVVELKANVLLWSDVLMIMKIGSLVLIGKGIHKDILIGMNKNLRQIGIY